MSQSVPNWQKWDAIPCCVHHGPLIMLSSKVWHPFDISLLPNTNPFWILAFDQFWTINFEFLNFDHQKLGFAPRTGGFSKSDIERTFHTLVHAATAMTFRIATKNDKKVGVRPWRARCHFEMCRTIEPFWKKTPFTWCQRFSSDENHQVAKHCSKMPKSDSALPECTFWGQNF